MTHPQLLTSGIVVAMLLGFAGNAAQAGPIDEYHKALRTAVKAHEAAKEDLKSAQDGLRSAKDELADKTRQLDCAVKSAGENADVAKTAREMKADVERAEAKVSRAADLLKAEAKKQTQKVQDELNKLLDQKLTLIDSSWTIDGDFDPRTSLGFAWAKVPFGKLTQDQIEVLLSGKITLPELDL